MKKKIAVLMMATMPMLLAAGCSKPDESKIRSALVSTYKKAGLDDATANKAAACLAPKLHDNVSRSALNDIIDKGVNAKGTSDDEKAIQKAVDECKSSVAGG